MSIAASLLDIKHYFYILIDPHITRYHQTWRVLLYQLCYTNSSEVLFACMTLYNMRAVERFWGSRKYASFIAITFGLATVLAPTLTLVLRALTFNLFSYVPAGPTAIVFALLAQYHAIIPHIYKYRVAFSSSPPPPTPANSASSDEDNFSGITLSDKSYRYLLAAQLALAQWPGSLLGAAVGWTIGYCWRNEMLPGALTRWRVPGWVVGLRSQKRSEEFEGLRRRLEGESAVATGTQGQAQEGDARRRTVGQQIMEGIGGAL